MNFFTKKEQMVILVIVLLVILSLSFKFVFKDIIKTRDSNLEIISDDFQEEPEQGNIDLEDCIIMVHISGEVYNPGIIQLELGKRLADAVKLAGGLKKDADLDRINLAKKLSDEEKIYVPKIGEIVTDEIISQVIETSSNSTNESSKININNCSKGDLLLLPGIGDVLADRIIEYRNTNKFSDIQDIKNVSGIGDKKYEAIKDLITVR